jgi:hypothetical protein
VVVSKLDDDAHGSREGHQRKRVTRAKFPEGTRLLLVADEPQPEVELDDEDVAAIRRARASIRAAP